LTGTIFSVNDISGIPSIEVQATGIINLARIGGANVNVHIGNVAVNDGQSILQVRGAANVDYLRLQSYGNVIASNGAWLGLTPRIPVSANSGATISANGINFVNTSSATVSVTSGTNGNANVSFTVSGGVGAQGVQGAAGAQGSVGAQGAPGTAGVQGAVGAQGSPGTAGAQGAVGAQGADGGQLTAGNYVVRANKNGTTQTVTNGADAVVTFIDDFDPQGWFASNKFQPTIAGYYSLDVSVWWNAGAVTNDQTNIQIRKNGTTQLAFDQAQIVTGSGYGQSLSTIAYFNGTTDYVEVTAFTGNTTSQDINGAAGGTFFAAALYAYGPPGAQGVQGTAGSPGAQGVQGATGAPALTYTSVFGDGSNTTYTFTHNLNVSSYITEVRRVSTGILVYPDVVIANTNVANVTFSITPTTNEYRLSLIGF
jgi:hypothetical protein